MIMKLLGYPSKEQKLHIAVFLVCLCFMPIHAFLDFGGRGFPQQSELRYSTGILEYSRAPGKNSLSYIVLQPIERTDKKMGFGCNYSAAALSGSCMSLQSTEAYIGKQATIGWYSQPNFLWFENRVPQMVTLEVEGEYLKTYEETYDVLRKTSKYGIYNCLFFMALSILIFVFFMYPKKQGVAD